MIWGFEAFERDRRNRVHASFEDNYSGDEIYYRKVVLVAPPV